MLEFDSKLPAALAEVQKWFGGVITQPLQDNNTIAAIAPSGISITVEAKRYIQPSSALQSYERIQIYNQQYWWRLLTIMQENFPLVTRLFGYHDFNNAIAIPYLCAFPPHHFSLNCLGDRLLPWLKRHYRKKDRKLVYDAALVDSIYLHSFVTKSNAPLHLEENSEAFLSEKLFLQPHVTLIELPYALLSFRKELLKQEPDYWIETPFPKLKKETARYLIFRTRHNMIAWKELAICEFTLLQRFKKGSTVDAACLWLEKQSIEIRAEAEAALQNWFREWTLQGLLSLEAP